VVLIFSYEESLRYKIWARVFNSAIYLCIVKFVSVASVLENIVATLTYDIPLSSFRVC